VETDGEWTFHEGCLSVPGLSWDITRFKDVHLTGFDLDGNELDIQTRRSTRRGSSSTRPTTSMATCLIERLDADQRREAKIFLRENRERLGVSDPTDSTASSASRCVSPSSAPRGRRAVACARWSTPDTTSSW
jgi:hypothetical protein